MAFKNLICLLISFSFLQLATAQKWTVTERSSMPEKVSNNAVAEGFINGTPYIYSFAGIDTTKSPSGIHLRSFRYNTMTDVWETIAPLPDDMGKIAASASRVGDIIYIIGGYYVFNNFSELSSDNVHRYDIVNNTYLTDGTPIPIEIDDQVQAVWRDSLIYVITGWTGDQSGGANVPNVQIYNPTTDSWMSGTSTPDDNFYKSFGSNGVIFNDTIYYFGGARSSGFFSSQNTLRKGVINPDNPTEIEWSHTFFADNIKGYRPAATIAKDNIFWLGGSSTSYNFDGIAYNGSGGVSLSNRSIAFNPTEDVWTLDFSNELPMDLRGIGVVNDTVKYLVGGMTAGQQVNNKTLQLVYQDSIASNIKNPIIANIDMTIAPNPISNYVELTINETDWADWTIRITDQAGKVIFQNKLNSNTERFDLSKQATGIYYLSLLNSNRIATRKFIKMK